MGRAEQQEFLDLAILGGGPAGLTLALELHYMGAPVRAAVFEKERYPRFKVCAGGLAGSIRPQMERLGLPIPEPNVVIRGADIQFRGRTLGYSQPDIGYVVRRDVLDNGLAQACRERGIDLREDCGIDRIERLELGFRLHTARGPVRCRSLALCTGASSRLRRDLGIPEPVRRARLLMMEGPIGENEADNRFVFDLSELGRGVQGYVWDFPYRDSKGCVRMNRGVMDVQGRGRTAFPRADMSRLLDERAERAGIDPQECTKYGFSERPFLARSTFALPGALCVGEAVGIDPLFGEGIGEAMEMAKLAAEVVVTAFEQDASPGSEIQFSGYRKRVLGSSLGRSLRVLSGVSRLAYGRHWKKLIRLLFEHPEIGQHYCQFFAGERLPRWAYLGGAFALMGTMVRPAPRDLGSPINRSVQTPA